MLGTISAAQVDNAFLMMMMGFMCFLSQFLLVVGFMVIMIASGKWDVWHYEEKVLQNTQESEKYERLYQQAGWTLSYRYFDPERANRMVLMFKKRSVRLFKDIL